MKCLLSWSSVFATLLGLGVGAGFVEAAQYMLPQDDPDIKSVPLRTHSLFQVGGSLRDIKQL